MKKASLKRVIKRILASFFLIVIFSIIGFYLYLRTQYVVPILMYHKVNNTAKESDVLTVREKTFQRQMEFLYLHKYNVISLRNLIDLINTKSKIPRNTVVITFDDGWADNYKIAFPILKKYHLPATIFSIVGLIDIDHGMLSSAQMKEMIATGLIEIGSHTYSHVCLNKSDSTEQIRKEMLDSKKILKEKLGQEIKLISYPIGGFSPLVRDIAIETGYKGAVSVNPGKDYPDTDVYGLKRLRISKSSTNLFVFWFEISGYYTWFKEHRGGTRGQGSYIQRQLAR